MFTGSQAHELQDSVHFIEDTDITRQLLAYPVGKLVGVRDLKTNEMKFIRLSEEIREITAIAVSNKTKFMAVCETHQDDNAAYITFYDMKSSFYKNIKSHINVCE